MRTNRQICHKNGFDVVKCNEFQPFLITCIENLKHLMCHVLLQWTKNAQNSQIRTDSEWDLSRIQKSDSWDDKRMRFVWFLCFYSKGENKTRFNKNTQQIVCSPLRIYAIYLHIFPFIFFLSFSQSFSRFYLEKPLNVHFLSFVEHGKW